MQMPSSNNAKDSAAKAQQYQELVRKVTERVWELWRQDMRRGQERRTSTRRS
jgi:hypothetical protein